MKKSLFFAIALLAMTACGGPKKVITSRIVESLLLDYREYAEQGFLVSPYEYTSDYEAIGEIKVYVEPANVEKEFESQYTGGRTYIAIAQEDITLQELADIAVEKAKETGADALVNFRIEKKPLRGSSFDVYYTITGFCIKRK